MTLAPSSLSRACRSVADFISAQLAPADSAVQVLLGTPAAAASISGDPVHRLNLFFYRVAPSGFDSQSLPELPWRVRVHCLITPFGIDEEGVSAGENDLRILGEVMRILHEQPILPQVGVNGESVRLHAVFEPLDLDSLNRLWTTQGEVTLRPSVSYELALAPIVPAHPLVEGPRVSALGLDVAPSTTAETPPAAPDVTTPDVPVVRVDTSVADWAPHICLVQGGQAAYALSFQVGSPELAAFTPEVWIAGQPGAQVTLSWQQWEAASGWSDGPTSTATASTATLDPALAATATLTATALPFTDRPGQFLLLATRAYTRPSDGAALVASSNPLLVTLTPSGGGG